MVGGVLGCGSVMIVADNKPPLTGHWPVSRTSGNFSGDINPFMFNKNMFQALKLGS